MDFVKKVPFQLIFFLLTFGLLTMFINTGHSTIFPMSHIFSESLVENKNFFLDGTNLFKMNNSNEVIIFKDHTYTANQPFQEIVSSAIYFFIYNLGINYRDNFILSTSLVTMLSSVLAVSIISLLIFNIAYKITNKIFPSIFISLSSIFCTPIFPYSLEINPECFSAFFLVCSFYILFSNYNNLKKSSVKYLIAGGLFLGFSFFSSYNVSLLLLSFSLYVFMKETPLKSISFLIFVLIGLLPAFIFNYYMYGGLLWNYPNLSPSNMTQNFNLYLINPQTAVYAFSPLSVLGFLGLFIMPDKFKIEKIVILTSFGLYLLYLLLMQLNAWCQYGPKQLIVVMPFLLIGLSGYFIEDVKKTN